jgi:hypothetical protein
VDGSSGSDSSVFVSSSNLPTKDQRTWRMPFSKFTSSHRSPRISLGRRPRSMAMQIIVRTCGESFGRRSGRSIASR